MGTFVASLVFLCCCVPSAELKIIRLVAASQNDATNEITDEHAQAVATALVATTPEGMVEGFHYEAATLTVFAYLPFRKPKQVIIQATHLSDGPTTSVFEVETLVPRLLIGPALVDLKTQKIAEVWGRVRHPELKDSLVPIVTIAGKRVEVVFGEPEIMAPEQVP